MTIIKDAPLRFKYLNFVPLGARGGVTRFFMLSQGLAFEEDLVTPGPNWAAEKKRLIESGENPAGTLPIIYSNGAHPQHIAVSRYIARVHGLTSGDDYKDYVQDLVADEYQSWRNDWVKVTFSGSDEDKASYKSTDVPKYLTKFNALYETFQQDEVFLSRSSKTNQPLWGDAAVYGLLRDHVLTNYITVDDLSEFPKLSKMYASYAAIPAIKEWLDKLN